MIQLGVNLTTLDAANDFITKYLLIRYHGKQKSRAAVAMAQNATRPLPTPTVEPVDNNGDQWQFLHDEYELLLDDAVAFQQPGLAAALSHSINLIEQGCHLPARPET